MEVDGSLVVQTLDNHMTNFTCSVSNEFGSDEVTYRLIKGLTRLAALPQLKVLTTDPPSFISLQTHRMCRKWYVSVRKFSVESLLLPG